MRKNGYTLIELLAALAISSVLILTASLIISTNLKVSADAYEKEISYKESNIAMMYIENIIKSSYKIELIDPSTETNFKVYAINPNSNDISSYKFKTHSPDGINTYLYAEIDNKSKGNSRTSTTRIAKCDTAYIFYDDLSQTVKIILNQNSPTNRYESLIHVGKKL